jgi:hypothetical protein
LVGALTSLLGQNIPPALTQYWNQLMQNFPQNAGGQPAVPTVGQPYPGVTNPIWGSGKTNQTQTQGQNPWGYYPIQPPQGQPGSSLWGENCICSHWFTDWASAPKSPVSTGESKIDFSCYFGSARLV